MKKKKGKERPVTRIRRIAERLLTLRDGDVVPMREGLTAIIQITTEANASTGKKEKDRPYTW